MRQGKTKALRHHAHDGVGHVAETQLPSDDVWVGRESRLPDVVSDHDDPRCAGLLIGLDQRPPKNGALPHDTKRGRADLRDCDRLRRGIADDHVPVAITIRRKVLHGRQGVTPRHEVMKGRRSFTGTGGIDHHDPDNPRAAVKRQRWGA